MLQEFETDLSNIKARVFSTQQKFKQALDVCHFSEKLVIEEKIKAILIAWNRLLSASQYYHHLLDTYLLQLGQLNDALAELMTWVNDMEFIIDSVSTDGAVVKTIEEQLSVLQVIFTISSASNSCMCQLMYCTLHNWDSAS